MVNVVYNTYPVYETFCMISFSVHNCCLIWSLLLIKDVACVQAQRKLFKIAWEGKSWIEQGFISLFYFDKWCACRKWNFGGEKNRGNSNPPASPDQHSKLHHRPSFANFFLNICETRLFFPFYSKKAKGVSEIVGKTRRRRRNVPFFFLVVLIFYLWVLFLAPYEL